jgi:hypothetical protein
VVESVAVIHHAVIRRCARISRTRRCSWRSTTRPTCVCSGNVLNRAPEDIAIGARVRVAFEDVKDPGAGEALAHPQWEVVS